MTHEHLRDGSNGVHILERTYKGNGIYFQRGYCKNISVGDTFDDLNKSLLVHRVEKVSDAKANNWTEEQCKDAYYEATLVDEKFSRTQVLQNM